MRPILYLVMGVALTGMAPEDLQMVRPSTMMVVPENDPFARADKASVSLGTFRTDWFREFTPKLSAFRPRDGGEPVYQFEVELRPLRSPGTIRSVVALGGEPLREVDVEAFDFNCSRNCYNSAAGIWALTENQLRTLRSGTHLPVRVETTNGPEHYLTIDIPPAALAALSNWASRNRGSVIPSLESLGLAPDP